VVRVTPWAFVNGSARTSGGRAAMVRIRWVGARRVTTEDTPIAIISDEAAPISSTE
jgi:hypothetical protein